MASRHQQPEHTTNYNAHHTSCNAQHTNSNAHHTNSNAHHTGYRTRTSLTPAITSTNRPNHTRTPAHVSLIHPAFLILQKLMSSFSMAETHFFFLIWQELMSPSVPRMVVDGEHVEVKHLLRLVIEPVRRTQFELVAPLVTQSNACCGLINGAA